MQGGITVKPPRCFSVHRHTILLDVECNEAYAADKGQSCDAVTHIVQQRCYEKGHS